MLHCFHPLPATSDNSLTFTVQCGLMKLNLTKTGVSVKSIAFEDVVFSHIDQVKLS